MEALEEPDDLVFAKNRGISPPEERWGSNHECFEAISRPHRCTIFAILTSPSRNSSM
jgi:hypothetical protein